MALYTKLKLSGSTDGRGILIAATATAGTTVHTAHATALDEVWLFAYNAHTAAVEVTVEPGGVTAPPTGGDQIKVSVPSKSGLLTVIPGLLFTNSVIIRVFAGTTNVIVCSGYVNRIS